MPVRPRPKDKPHPFSKPMVIMGLKRPTKQAPQDAAEKARSNLGSEEYGTPRAEAKTVPVQARDMKDHEEKMTPRQYAEHLLGESLSEAEWQKMRDTPSLAAVAKSSIPDASTTLESGERAKSGRDEEVTSSFEVLRYWSWEYRPAIWATFPEAPDNIYGLMFDEPSGAWVISDPAEIADSGQVISANLFAEMFPSAASNMSKVDLQTALREMPSL